MKVLAVLPSYPPESFIGSWLTTAVFLEDLARRGHDVLCVRYSGLTDRYQRNGVDVLVGAVNIETEVPKADVVISHLGDNHRAARAALAAGVPSIRLAHGHGVEQRHMEGAAMIIFNSAAFRDQIGCPVESMVIHPPVIGANYRCERGSKITLVNLSNDKGVKTFWRAAERLPVHEFLGVRGGYGQQIIPRASNVETIPTQPDVRDVFRQTRILLMPSRVETYGRVGIEAAHSGIPTIAHPTPGLVEALGPAGIFLDRSDVEGWVAELQRLDDPIEYEQASRKALAHAESIDTAGDLERFADLIERVGSRVAA